jgi:hydrogenase nickel incorporation protein HypA/HybF
MHEQALASGLVRAVEAAAEAQGARKVVAIRVRVPELRPVSVEHLRLHFERVAAGTLAEGAQLEIRAGSDVAEVAVEQIEVED